MTSVHADRDALLARAVRAEADLLALSEENEALFAEQGPLLQRLHDLVLHTTGSKTGDDVLTIAADEIERLTAELDAIAAVTLEQAAMAVEGQKWASLFLSTAHRYQNDRSDYAAAAIRALSPLPPHVAAARLVKVKPLVFEPFGRA